MTGTKQDTLPQIDPEEFFHRMLKISCSDDQEERHGKADGLLCQVLAQLGYGDGVRVFRKMDKWYA